MVQYKITYIGIICIQNDVVYLRGTARYVSFISLSVYHSLSLFAGILFLNGVSWSI